MGFGVSLALALCLSLSLSLSLSLLDTHALSLARFDLGADAADAVLLSLALVRRQVVLLRVLHLPTTPDSEVLRDHICTT